MFKKFLLIVCGSLVGSFIAMGVICLCLFAFSLSMMLSMNKMAGSVSNNSILELRLEGSITERATAQQMNMMTMIEGIEPSVSLEDIQHALEVAKTNDKIKGVVINCQGCSATPATLRAVRKAVLDFKTSKKWVYAYGSEGIAQGDYYIASAADSVMINPYGAVDVHGLASSTQYYKKLLAKVGVEVQVIRVGAFKSAVEPFMLDDMSPENREQQELYLGNIWNTMVKDMSTSRKISPSDFNALADTLLMTKDTEFLKSKHLIDATYYRPDFENLLKKRTGIEETDDLNWCSIENVAANYSSESGSEGEIAVVYAVGEIDGGQGDGIDSEELVDVITDLKNNDDVKGLVLRVNSPGGSAFGSEQIWKALEDFKAKGKTFAVSMGGYAASGGYYISCGAQRIFADSTTITGSIGIFGMIPCAQELVENKLGVHTAVVKTNQNADLGTGYGIATTKLTPMQLQSLQNMINAGYELFTSRCAQGRKMKQDAIKAIGGGHVWDGISAKANGLIDQFGTLQDAIDWVAKTAKLHTGTYSVNTYPSTEMSFTDMLQNMGYMHAQEQMKSQMGMFYTYYEQLQAIESRQHVLCLMTPAEIK